MPGDLKRHLPAESGCSLQLCELSCEQSKSPAISRFVTMPGMHLQFDWYFDIVLV